ncbi:MAG: hypothetical protein Q8M37_11115 [Nevskia sp.]|nr:hypothetical protein [Nevskia sp.]
MNDQQRLAALIRTVDPVAASVPSVSAQAAGALDQAIDRREIGDHQIDIAIQRHFQHLRANHQLSETLLADAVRS